MGRSPCVLARSVEGFEAGEWMPGLPGPFGPSIHSRKVGSWMRIKLTKKPAIRRGAIHKTDGVLLGIPFVISMLAPDDQSNIPRGTPRIFWIQRERNPRARQLERFWRSGETEKTAPRGVTKPEQLGLPR